MADAPLPLGWEQSTNDKGSVYFIDHVKRSTTFDDPRLSSHENKKQKKKKKGKLPKYNSDIFSKSMSLVSKLHQQLGDDSVLNIVVSRDKLYEDSYSLISGLDALTLSGRLFIRFEGEEYVLQYEPMSPDILYLNIISLP
eukprot:TRINITY_DN393_c0_g2_i3.p2 TRINITY_DN393_c0_g2~~TRINITY_DN393_c0_g2_i3.p2  ORF type:complete len:140 (-),score=11.04 TRINITY_DN393_c0_g2_i3:44-463(-)